MVSMSFKSAIVVLAAAAVLFSLVPVNPAVAQVTAGARKTLKKIEGDYGVKVLKVRPVVLNGRKAYAVSVMNPPGDFNEALQVNHLLVDAATGKLVSQFRHKNAGYDRSGEAPGAGGLSGEDTGRASRRRSVDN